MLDKLIEYISRSTIGGLLDAYRKKSGERHYELTELSDIFGPIEPLLKYYVEPNCQNINPANYDEAEPDAVARTPIFDFLNRYFNREFAVQGDGRNQLFILSDAGVGKTSLLMMVKLCNLLPQLSWDHSFNGATYVELVKLDIESLGRIRKMSDKSHTILLLDALDEDPLAWQKPEKRLLNILEATSGFRRVIISCRTQFFPDKGVQAHGTQDKITVGGYICPMIYLSLFDESQVLRYLENRFPVHELADNSRKIARSLEILRLARSLTFRPFLLAHIEDLLDRDHDDWSELAIYRELTQVWIRRELRKAGARGVTEEDLRLACMALASKMQESGTRHVSKNELAKVAASIPLVSHISNIEYNSKSFLNRNSSGDYRFSHFSIQEFFLAEYILELSRSRHVESRARFIPVNRSKIRLTRKALEFISMSTKPGWVERDGFLLQDRNLDGFDFSEGDWSGFNFSGSSLNGADFTGANLTGATFSGASLVGTKMLAAQCAGCSFRDATFVDASLVNANTTSADFSGATFDSSDLRGATDISRRSAATVFRETVMPDGRRSRR